jgi:hypothetical protein
VRVTDAMVDRFLSWPLPADVRADMCATDPTYPHQRHGTNLLTATQARQMLEHVLNVQAVPGPQDPPRNPERPQQVA